MGTPINPGDLQFTTREYYLDGGDDYAAGNTLSFQQLDTTLIFLSNSIATAGTSFVGLTTASVNLNTINFSKSNGTTFSITVDTGSTATVNTGSLLLTASANLNTITFTKGDNTTQFSITVDTGSGQTYTAGNGININGSNVVSAKLGAGLEFDLSNQIQSQIRTVNLQTPTNGNISLSITNTITGPSSSLSGSPFFLPDTYSPRPPISGTIFVVSGDGDINKNGNAYIFVTSSTQAGSWQQIFGFNETTADARYVKLASTSTQTITSSLLISGSTTFSGSLSWSGSSNANGATANVVVLSNGQLYVTGAYGSGGGGATPGGANTTIQFNDGGAALSGSGNFTFDKTTNVVNISGSLIVTGSTVFSSSLQVIGTTRITGSLIVSSSSQIIGTETITGSLIVSSSSNVIGTSRVTGSLIVSNSLNVTGTGSITGSLIVSRSTDNTAIIVGSGSNNPLLNVLGSQGQLFSVYDTLSGSLFSVNDISGLPILEVKSDITTLIGSYQAPALHTSRRVVSTVGSNIIYNGIPTSSYNAAIIDYNLTSASYAKVGSIMTAWSSSTITTQTEYATASVAGGNYPTMSLQISGANLIITASAASANWVIKTIIRSI